MQSNNFEFLSTAFPDLAECCKRAEEYVWGDPSASIVKSRIFLEMTLNLVSLREGINADPTLSLADRLNGPLKFVLSADILDRFHRIRIEGNRAAHCEPQSSAVAMEVLKDAFEIGKWTHSRYASPIHKTFVKPTRREDQFQILDKELKEKDALIRSLADRLIQKELERDDTTPAPPKAPKKIAQKFEPLFETDGFEFGKEVVRDTRTNLFWARNANIPGFPPRGKLFTRGNVTTPDGFAWLQAQKWAESLDLSGYYDWRLPTTEEFTEIFSYAIKKGFGRYYGTISDNTHKTNSLAAYFCSIGFEGVISNIVGSSYWTCNANEEGEIWHAKASDGRMDNFTNANNLNFVWPVRDGNIVIRERYKQYWVHECLRDSE